MTNITEYGRHISNRFDHPRDHQSDYQYISSPVSDVVEVVDTDKDSSLLVSAIFNVSNYNNSFKRIRIKYEFEYSVYSF